MTIPVGEVGWGCSLWVGYRLVIRLGPTITFPAYFLAHQFNHLFIRRGLISCTPWWYTPCMPHAEGPTWSPTRGVVEMERFWWAQPLYKISGPLDHPNPWSMAHKFLVWERGTQMFGVICTFIHTYIHIDSFQWGTDSILGSSKFAAANTFTHCLYRLYRGYISS